MCDVFDVDCRYHDNHNKVVFPENEEEYITRIVEIIQNNDLEHKKENIRVKSMVQSEEVLKDIQTKS